MTETQDNGNPSTSKALHPKQSATVLSSSGIELLSALYKRKCGIVKPSILYEYAKEANRILKLNSPLKDDKDFLTDYLEYSMIIAADQAKMSNEPNEQLGRDVIHLPITAQTTIKLNELVVTPENFNGVRPKPRKWIQNYNEAITANGWSDHIAIKYLPTFLSGPAKDWYITEVKPYVDITTKWYSVYKYFVANYLGDRDYEELMLAIENTKQRAGESISNFMPRIRRLILLLNPYISETEQLRQLKSKILPHYRKLVAFSDPKTLSEFRTSCLKIEAGEAPNRSKEDEKDVHLNKPRRLSNNKHNANKYQHTKPYNNNDRKFGNNPNKNKNWNNNDRSYDEKNDRRKSSDITC